MAEVTKPSNDPSMNPSVFSCWKYALFAALCLLCGCFNLTEEYFFNADHSGRYVMSIDMSKITTSTAKARQSWQRQKDSLIQLGRPLLIDSTFSVMDREPDSIRRFVRHPELFSKFKGRLLVDYENRKTVAQFSYDFRDLDELRFFWQEWQRYKYLADSIKGKRTEPQNDNAMNGAVPDFFGSQLPEFRWEGRDFNMSYQFKSGANQEMDELKNDDSAFARNLLKSFKYRIYLHFPKDVKSFKGEGYQKEGNTLSLESDLYELATARGGLSVEAKLKR